MLYSTATYWDYGTNMDDNIPNILPGRHDNVSLKRPHQKVEDGLPELPSPKRHHKVKDDHPFRAEFEECCFGTPESGEPFDRCVKNPGHQNFIPVKELKMSDLPEGLRTESVMESIKKLIDRTVRIVVKYISEKRPDYFPYTTKPYPNANQRGRRVAGIFGTGFIYKCRSVPDKACPCMDCRNSGDPKIGYTEFRVSTATHVVFDELELKETTIELFFDSPDRDRVKYIKGVSILDFPGDGYNDYQHDDDDDDIDDDDDNDDDDDDDDDNVVKRCRDDVTYLWCVSHDHFDLPKRYIILRSQDKPKGFIISHPHGGSKHITIGGFTKTDLPFQYTDTSDVKIDLPLEYVADLTQIDRKSLVGEEEIGKYKVIKCKDAAFVRVPESSFEIIKGFFPKFMNESWYKPFIGFEFYVGGLHCLIPRDVDWHYSYDNLYRRWMDFPPDTIFYFKECNQSFCIPELEIGYDYIPLTSCYDIDTCPGSSGAPVFGCDLLYHLDYAHTHSGSLGIRTNIGAIDYFLLC